MQVVNDLNIEEVIIAVPQRQEFLDKVQRRVATIQINQLTEPREDKKLLVLDIDYTLFGKRYLLGRAFGIESVAHAPEMLRRSKSAVRLSYLPLKSKSLEV